MGLNGLMGRRRLKVNQKQTISKTERETERENGKWERVREWIGRVR